MEKKNEYGLTWIFKKTKGIRFLFWLLILFVIINNILSVSIAYFLKLFVDVATGDLDASLLSIGTFALAAVSLVGLFTILSSILAQSIQRRIERNLNTELMSIIFTRRFIDISRHHTGELLTKTSDIQAVSNCYVSIARNIIGSIVMSVMAIAGLFYLNWKMASIMLLVSPLMLLAMGIFNRRIKNVSEIDKKNGEIIRSTLQEHLNRIMLVKTYSMNKNITEKIKKAYIDKISIGKKLGICEGLISFSGIIEKNIIFMVALGVGAYFVLSGETTVGSLIAIVQLLNFVIEPVSSVVNSISTVNKAIVSAGRIGKIYELPPDKDMPLIPVVDAIELAATNISFTYDKPENSINSDVILHKISAKFEKGAVTGIVGKSGSGKSTLLKILIGLFLPQGGRVELIHSNGELTGEAVLSQIAYVPPADYLFSGSITDNIVMFDEKIRLDDLKSALIDADIFDYVQSLPNGADSLIGESGSTVTAGQAQRIAIARAIYKKSPVIVFDDPTSNLDVESIAKFHSTVRKLAKDKICIIVTHDVSTMDICDKVYILENGSLTEKSCCKLIPLNRKINV